MHVDEIDNPYIDALQSYIDVSEVSLLPLTDDAVQFTAKLSLKTKEYVIKLSQNAKYIVMTKDRKIYEYNMFNASNRYFLNNSELTPYRTSLPLEDIHFFGINDIASVEYIKITGLSVCKTDISNTIIKKNLELELYKAN